MVGVFASLFMDQGVVVAAEETEVVENCFASVGPEDNVVDVTPAGRPATAGSGAVTVSGDDGST
jgi:hypothetical protein